MFAKKVRELPIPPQISAGNGTELVRVWTNDEGAYVSVATGVYEEPGVWGIVLADLVRHVANAYEQAEGLDRAEVIQQIMALFAAEWDAPTDEPTGAII